MKRLLGCLFAAGLIGCICVSAQEPLYLGGQLTITGTDAPLVVSEIRVGSGSTFDYGNRLYISDGGYVNCLGSMRVNGTYTTGVQYNWLYSYASISGDGSLLEIGGDLSLWSEWNDPSGGGVPCHMEISGGAEVSVAGDVSIINRSYMKIDSGGRLSIGSDLTSSEGALNIASNGLLKMQVNRYGSGKQLYVTGDSYLDGTLDITFLQLSNDLPLSYGDSFDLFNWDGGVNGEFASITTTALAGDLAWDTSELYTTGTITVIPEPASLGLIGLVSSGIFFVRRTFRI